MPARSVLLLIFAAFSTVRGGEVSPLAGRGYTVLPYPQQVELAGADIEFGPGWSIVAGPGVPPDAIAITTLREQMRERFQISLEPGSKHIYFNMSPGTVVAGPAQDRNRDALAIQAYRLEILPSEIRITANSGQGLFYGAETLVQLVKRQNGAFWLPAVRITDWPDLELRNIYWDDAHHLDRMEVLKAAIRQTAFFKANGLALKLEGHFEFAHAPAVIEPQALTPAQLQELTDYGLRYYVQVIPYLDAPAHLAFLLKHPEYSRFRAFPDSNYEMCTTNPAAYQLLEGMLQDLLAASQGVHYFILSTDEPYYVGLAQNAQCDEAGRAKKLGGVGAVLNEFISRAAGYLHDNGREVIFWGEYPLKPKDIAGLPPWIINGETYGPEFDSIYRARGIRQMIYTSTEGEEKMFPSYFVLPAGLRRHPDREIVQRVASGVTDVAENPARKTSDLMGMLVAGWGDMGLHPETFWLGYATISAAGWNPASPSSSERMSAFYPLFYGDAATNMNRAYQLMSLQAQIWTDTWDTVDSTARKPIWGDSNRVFQQRRPAHDQSLPLPSVPSAPDLGYASDWARTNASRVSEADAAVPGNDELLGLLHENIRLVASNHYNLEVFAALAALYRQNLELIADLAGIDDSLTLAAKEARAGKASAAVVSIDRALAAAEHMRSTRNRVLADATEVWYRSWLPRVSGANGRRFLHQVDDVKDHLPDRTVDMSFLVYRQLQLPLDYWYARTQAARNKYAQSHNLPQRNETLRWLSME